MIGLETNYNNFDEKRNPSKLGIRSLKRSFLAPLFLRVRCASCEKLYRIDARDIKSQEPHFECLVCQSVFGFVYPPANPMEVKAKVIRHSLKPLEGLVSNRPMDVRSCEKCSALNAKGAKECRLCGVNFSLIAGMPMDPAVRARPSLMKAWRDLMSDYSNITKHLHFVERCEDLQAIPFALKKYQDLKESQPHDQLADEMLHRVFFRNVGKQINHLGEVSKFNELSRRINWVRFRRVLPWVMSIMFLGIGLSNNGNRNLAGVGAALLFITMGLHLMLKGRITLNDFW